jgi:WD40 repeat protein
LTTTLAEIPERRLLVGLEGLPDASGDDHARHERKHAAEAEFQLDRSLRKLRARAILSDRMSLLSDAAFNGDGTRVVTASADGMARVWDVATGKEIARLRHDGWLDPAE